MHPNLPLWGKLIALSLSLAVLVAGFAFTAIVGPMAGDGLASLGRSLMDRYGTWAGYALLFGFIGILGISAYWVNRRNARREYQRTRTITVEKPHKTPQWAKVMLWGQLGLFVLIFGGIVISTAISASQ
jgi:ABC-type Fe3+ transport system permease subunit